MPRICSVCGLPREARSEVTSALAEVGQGLRSRSAASIAREANVSAHSMSRHIKNGHEKRSLPAVLTPEARADLNLASVVTRLTDVAESARLVRLAAQADGHRGDALKAAEAEGRVLGTLLARLGVTDLGVSEALREGALLARATAAACREEPEVADAVLRHLKAIGAESVARDLAEALAPTITRFERQENSLR